MNKEWVLVCNICTDMNNKSKHRKSLMAGTATIELVVVLVLFIPLLSSIPLLGKYLDFKQKNIDAGRYAAWERTVWSDPVTSGGSGTVKKPDSTIRFEVDIRFFGDEQQRLSENSKSENTLWGNKNVHGSLVKQNSKNRRVNVATYEVMSPIRILLADNYAYKGFRGIGGFVAGIGSLASPVIRAISSSCNNLPGIGYERGMDLASNNYASIAVNSNIKNMRKDDEDLDFSNTASILSNSWVASSEAIYKKRVSRLVLEEPVECLTSFSKLISIFPLYREGRNASSVMPIVSTSMLLQKYKASR